MAKKKSTKIDDLEPEVGGTKYAALSPSIEEDWTFRTVNKPFYDSSDLSYSIVIQSGKKIKGDIYLDLDSETPPKGDTSTTTLGQRPEKDSDQEERVVNQETFPAIIDEAKERILEYYNKKIDEQNLSLLAPITVIRKVSISTRPRAPNLFYVSIDAPTLDSIPNLGNYVLTPITKESTINQIAEEYKDFFSNTANTAKSRRDRVSEILRSNGIDVLSAGKKEIEEWIYQVNYGATTPPGRDVKFNDGAKIYLPRTEPDFSRIVDGGREIELEIGTIREDISKLVAMLEDYKQKLRDSQFVAKNFDPDRQISSLEKFLPLLRGHFTDNDYDFRTFLEDSVRIGLDKDFALVYIGISSAGQVAYLNKAIPGLAKESPFNDKRVMNLIANLQEISLLSASTLPWKDFIGRYIIPEVKIVSRDPESVYADLQKNTKTILEQLAGRFDKFSTKSNRQLGEENSIYGNVQIMNGIFNQQINKVNDTGDAVFQNMADISAKIQNPGDTALGAGAIVYNEVLNKVDFKSLLASAIECLKEQIPFDCEDVLMAVAEANIDLVHATFKARTNPNYHDILEQSLIISKTADFTLYENFYTTLGDTLSGKSEAEIYFGVLEFGLASQGADYDSISAEVCSILSNPKEVVSSIFSIPTIFLPDNLVTVDIDGELVKNIEKAILQMVASLVVGMVQAVIDTILNKCKEGDPTDDNSASPGYGEGPNLGAAIASKIGVPNLAKAIEELYDSLGYGLSAAAPVTPPGNPLSLTGSFEVAPTFEEVTTTTEQFVEVENKFALMRDLFSILKQELTSPEIIRLLEGNASNTLLDVVLEIVDTSDELVGLRNVISNREDLKDMFFKVSNLADLGPTIEQVNILSNQLGCSLDDFVSSRVPLWCAKIPPGQVREVSEQTVIEEKKNFADFLKTFYGPTDVLTPDITCQDEESPVKGMVPKDTTSFSRMLEQVLKTVFDGVYMAYDSAVLTLPDPFFVPVKSERRIDRTMKVGQGLNINYYNFSKLQEETLSIDIPGDDTIVGGIFDGLGLSEKRVINPEFQRAVSQGIVPADGDPNGQYGPYTTKEPFKLLPPWDSPLPAITINEDIPTFAANSRFALENSNNIQFTASDSSVSFALTEPFNENNFKLAQYVAKLDLNQDNTFDFQIGQIPVDPGTLAPNSQDGMITPGFSISPFNSAIYNKSYSDDIIFPTDGDSVRGYVNNETGFIGDENPQVASLARFLEIILRNGVRSSGLTTAQREDIVEFTKQSMFSDIMKQLVSGISFDILQSPMFNFTKDNNVPYMSLVDWAPLPTEDEAECGYDPHILAIDTFRRRIREDYENKIECSPIENEISANALGRKDLSSLEAASMSGLIMTTLRAYGLEQLVREVFPVSTFIGREFLSQVHVKYIVDQVRDKMYEKSSAYFEAFLGQLEKTFEDRMEEFSPYGSIPTVISEAEAIGVKWVYAQAALDEFNGTAEGSSETVAAITSAPLTPPAELSPDVPVNPAAELFGEPDEGIDQIFATLGTSEQPSVPGESRSQDFEIVSGDPTDTETVTPTPSFCEDENSAVVIPTTSLYNIMENRFSFLVEEQLYSVLDKLQDLTSFEGEKSFYDRFISKGMPLFDIQKNPGDPRFSEADGVDLITLEQMEIDRQYITYQDKYDEWVAAKMALQASAMLAPVIPYVGILLQPAILAADRIPMPKIVAAGESDIFYTSAGGTNYKYLNFNLADVLANLDPPNFLAPPTWLEIGDDGFPSGINMTEFWKVVMPEDDGTGTNLVNFPKVQDFVTGLDEDSTTKLNSVKPTRGELEVPFNLSEQQGQIILEKYVKTTTPPSLGAFSTQDNFTGQRYADTVEQPESLGRISEPGSSFQQLASTSAITVSEVLSPRESVNTSARSCKPGVPSEGVSIEEVISSHESTEKLGGEINIAREKIWNISDFESHIRDLATSNPDMLLSDKYEKVSFGLRMVYVAPLNDFIVNSSDVTTLPNQRKLATEEFIFDESVVDASKSFIQYEEIEILEKVSFGVGDAQVGFDNPLVIMDKPVAETDSPIYPIEKKRVLRLFPLEAVEMSDRQLPPDTKMSDFLTKLSVGDDEKYQNVDRLYQNKYMAILQNDLKQSSTFNYLFRYSVPGDFLLSFVSIYSNLVNEIDETFFDKTKFELKSLFETLENGGDYTFQTSEEKKSGGNRGAYARASANYGSEGAARNPGLFDLAVKTPKLIFKGLTEFIDPCISVASKIVKAGNAGNLLPQTMKVLNPDGTAGGVNDKNYFLTDIVLPSGSVPPPIGDILGKNPTVIQKNVLPTDSTRDYPGNNEIVTFRLRDSITKDSEEGNSLFDKYLQKVFFNYKPNKNEIFNVYSNSNTGEIDDLGNFGTEKTRLFQRFASGLVVRDVQTMSITILQSYSEDLEVVRQGIIKELEGRYSNIRDYLTKPFTPFVFKALREADDPFLCDAGDEVLAILKGERKVDPSNFISADGTSLATGNIQSVNPDTGLLEVVPDEHTIDWVIWGNVNGAFTVPAPPNPEPILPGYPLPLPITPVAMSLLPADMLGGYGPGPPHSPLGHIYHAIVAAEGLSNLTLEQKAVQREREGLENKKKLRGKLCIDIDQIAAEERKRRGME